MSPRISSGLHRSYFSYFKASLKLQGESQAAAATKLLQSCPTVQPHRRQPTRLPHPWDSSSKNAGVGCHFLLQCMKVKSESEVAAAVAAAKSLRSCPICATP